jgi:hypothetical protein
MRPVDGQLVWPQPDGVSLGLAHSRSALSLAPCTSSTGVAFAPVCQPGAW